MDERSRDQHDPDIDRERLDPGHPPSITAKLEEYVRLCRSRRFHVHRWRSRPVRCLVPVQLCPALSRARQSDRSQRGSRSRNRAMWRWRGRGCWGWWFSRVRRNHWRWWKHDRPGRRSRWTGHRHRCWRRRWQRQWRKHRGGRQRRWRQRRKCFLWRNQCRWRKCWERRNQQQGRGVGKWRQSSQRWQRHRRERE